jgi:hypothetical protein
VIQQPNDDRMTNAQSKMAEMVDDMSETRFYIGTSIPLDDWGKGEGDFLIRNMATGEMGTGRGTKAQVLRLVDDLVYNIHMVGGEHSWDGNYLIARTPKDGLRDLPGPSAIRGDTLHMTDFAHKALGFADKLSRMGSGTRVDTNGYTEDQLRTAAIKAGQSKFAKAEVKGCLGSVSATVSAPPSCPDWALKKQCAEELPRLQANATRSRLQLLVKARKMAAAAGK